mmetsp:Transcript_17306/g.28745  ORF Transcript_17306/g.28745 Transcript_17306/m.28745 type:complete len:510 (-) Transcript_17306:100-1629(-)|eukprot:CAMPEP_0119007904 /NCGR_PEP_ID=MMETSP1176-20130426/3325_1 /TAXON_ID=265551 /ORGANISM="Synedropsis recta cf, Strain CCMP1620" /LENGTH=509 /DNA_ID=CAMNT_0006960137 /DNA_START=207 /DNA_END=1736 /DNA_ORIENTATION=+
MRKHQKGSGRCVCGDKAYNAKLAIPSVFYEDDANIANDEDCDIYSLICKMQYQLYEYEPIEEAITEKIVQRARKEIDELSLIKQITPARFDLDEITVGSLLGSGGFSNVMEVSSLRLNENGKHYTDLETKRRSDMVKLCNTKKKTSNSKSSTAASGGARTNNHRMPPYALKHLRRKLIKKPKKFANGAIDLALEAAFLSSLDHPNILKIHGVSSDGPAAYDMGRHDSYFLIVERLHETLQDRILTWRKQCKHLNSAWGRMTDKKGKKRDKLMADRLKVAFDIASALNYLHSRGLLYRDLKPPNIGFGLDNEVKLFDFGLCRELPPGADRSMDVTYDMSGGVGTYRYMSPEVANRERYNQGADVFSFGMVLYEILSLNQPTVAEGRKTVNPEHLRMCMCWPESIKHMLCRTWSPEISKRPTMQEVCIVLKQKITELRYGDSTGLDIPIYSITGHVVQEMSTMPKRFACMRMDEATVGTSSTSSCFSKAPESVPEGATTTPSTDGISADTA